MNHFAGKAVTAGPEWTLWASNPVGIVYTFLMGTSDDPVNRYHRQNLMFGQERANLLSDFVVRADITIVDKPSFHVIGFRAFARHDANGDLRCPLVIRTVEGNRRDRITAKAFAGPFEQRVFSPRFEFHVTDKVKHPTAELTRRRDFNQALPGPS